MTTDAGPRHDPQAAAADAAQELAMIIEAMSCIVAIVVICLIGFWALTRAEGQPGSIRIVLRLLAIKFELRIKRRKA